MGIIDRAQTVVASNFTALLNKLEEPGRDLALLLSEMKEQILRAQRELITIVGEAKREDARVATLRQEIERWEKRAEMAVRMGDDQLAREALGQKRRLLEEQRRSQESRAERLQAAAAMKAQVERMKELHRNYAQREHLIVTQVNQARAGGKVTNLGQRGDANPFEQFDRLESSIDGAEAEVQAQAEVNELLDRTALGSTTRTELDARFLALEAEEHAKATSAATSGTAAATLPTAPSAGATDATSPSQSEASPGTDGLPQVRVRVEP